MPQPEDFLADFNAYQNAAMAVLNLEAMLRDAIALREQQRGAIVGTMNVRAADVQQASNGNRKVILSSGLGVKSAPTYVTSLAAPTNLRVELNGEAGAPERGRFSSSSEKLARRAFSQATS
ncbi:MAG: hypothetical protein IAE77_08120 [Prosthecobacter sp.]|jgi:hypothetical protein|nr:hypothetical protein [Prosthecobacter sp.]